MLTTEEIYLIHDGVDNALCWGLGILSTCKELLADNGYTWTEQHEKVLMEICVTISKENL